MIRINISGDIGEQILQSCLSLLWLKISGSTLNKWQIVINAEHQDCLRADLSYKLIPSIDKLINLSIPPLIIEEKSSYVPKYKLMPAKFLYENQQFICKHLPLKDNIMRIIKR